MSIVIWILIPITVVLIILSAFFSGSEMAYSSVNIASLEGEIKRNKKWAKVVKRQLTHFDQLLMTLLIANNIVNILTTLVTGIFFGEFIRTYISSESVEFYSTLISLIVLTPLIVIFGEIVPKITAKKHSLIYLKTVVYLIDIVIYIFYPFTGISKLFKKKKNITNKEIDLKNYVELANQEGVITHAETELVKNAFDLDKEKVLSHYVRLKDVYTLEINTKVKDAIKVFKETSYSRIPLINEHKNIVGMIHVSDILGEEDEEVISRFMRVMPLIPLNISLNNALEILRSKKSHMAAVTRGRINDEIVGILTMEDIIEELVGEIYDEHDEDEQIMEVSLEKYFVWGNSKVADLIEASGMEIEHSEEETVLNLIKKYWDKEIIEVGDIMVIEENYSFEVLEYSEEKKDFYFELIIK
ncbi:hemolysin family protein [Mycoplasmopsis agassizii]|uniref:HlyC/CorC family transporter n=1 Tax=Mycoplasmopsis agassizii TaxID=33922 RepID=A0ABX4H5W8_9BACT|nr:hemolysin family protein [Mycoplasmopsis agassizii]PAF55297.1 HlyC/CorC family transporter [Mycoplasmopsis agassizii]SMC15717.1 Hemolysin, contains CBS domains [Mycoplasmopsis agassizii]